MRIARDSPLELARALAGPYWSTSSTLLPAARSCRAVHAPKAPAPTTTTSKLPPAALTPCPPAAAATPRSASVETPSVPRNVRRSCRRARRTRAIMPRVRWRSGGLVGLLVTEDPGVRDLADAAARSGSRGIRRQRNLGRHAGVVGAVAVHQHQELVVGVIDAGAVGPAGLVVHAPRRPPAPGLRGLADGEVVAGGRLRVAFLTGEAEPGARVEARPRAVAVHVDHLRTGVERPRVVLLQAQPVERRRRGIADEAGRELRSERCRRGRGSRRRRRRGRQRLSGRGASAARAEPRERERREPDDRCVPG